MYLGREASTLCSGGVWRDRWRSTLESTGKRQLLTAHDRRHRPLSWSDSAPTRYRCFVRAPASQLAMLCRGNDASATMKPTA